MDGDQECKPKREVRVGVGERWGREDQPKTKHGGPYNRRPMLLAKVRDQCDFRNGLHTAHCTCTHGQIDHVMIKGRFGAMCIILFIHTSTELTHTFTQSGVLCE